MKKLELEVVKYPGDIGIAHDIESTIQILQSTIQVMKTWTNISSEGVVLDGDYVVVERNN
jgi:hypothetical protein